MKAMKKICAFFLSAVLLLPSMTLAGKAGRSSALTARAADPSAAAVSYPVTLQNPSFELGSGTPSDWSVITGSDVANGAFTQETRTEGYVFRGAKSLKLTYTGTGTYGVVSDPVAVTPGTLYRLEMHSRTDAGSFMATLDFHDASGGVIAGASKQYSATGSGWKFITTNTSSGILPACAPDGAVYATVSLTVASGSTVYIDDVALTALTAGLTLANGGFEDGLDAQWDEPAGYSAWEWGYGYYGTEEIVSAPAHTGIASLKLTTVKRAYSNNTVRTGLVSVTAGKAYDFSVAVWKESGAQPYLSVEYYDANGAAVTAGKPANVSSASSGQWETLTIHASIPAGVAFATATVWQYGGDEAGVYYVDDFSIAPAAVPVSPVEAALDNPSFEKGTVGQLPDSWSKIGTSGSAVVADNGDGTHSLSLNWASDLNGVASNRFAVDAGAFYTVSCAFKNSTGQKPRVYLRFYDASGQLLAANFWLGYGYMELSPSLPGSASFLKASGYILSPAGAVSAQVTIEQTAQTGGSLLVDGVSVEKTPPAGVLTNGDFEDKDVNAIGYPVGWSAYFWTSGADVSLESDVTAGGSQAVRMDMTGAAGSSLRGGLISPLVSVTAGNSYTFSADFYNTGAGKLSLYCYWVKSDGTQVLTQYPASSKTNVWETVTTGKLNAPTGAVAAAVMIYQSGGVSYVDNVSIQGSTPVTYAKTLPNPGFEDGVNADGTIKSWSKYGADNSVELVGNIVHGGQYAVRLSSATLGGNGLRSSPVAVTAGESYRGSMMLYNDISTSELYLEFWNENSQRIGVATATLSHTGAWTEVDVDAAAPTGTVYATLLIYQASDVNGVVYADDGGIVPYTPQPETVRSFSASVSGHPKVLFTAADLASLRAKAQDTEVTAMGSSGKQIADQIFAQADAYLAEQQMSFNFDSVYGQSFRITIPSPPTGVDIASVSPDQPSGYGNYPFWTTISRGLEDRMEILSMAYILSGNTAYSNRAIQFAMGMTTWAGWHDPKDSSVTTNLDTADIVFGFSTVYDLLYDQMSADQRTAMQSALIQKGLEPLYADAEEKVDHNIQALRASALTTGALALMGDVDAADTNRYLTRATDFFTWYLNERKTSGNQEGFGYTSYATENMVDAFESLARVTGHNEYVDDSWLNDDLTKWVAAFSVPGAYTLAPVSDATESSGFYQTFSVLANHGNGLAGWYLSKAKPLSTVLLTKQFLYLNKAMPISDPQSTVGDAAVIGSVGWGAMRTGWNATDTLFGLVSNNTGLGHNHFDQNSFLIATNGQWLADDPGYSNFSYDQEWNFKSKVGHNTILVDWVKDTATGAQVYKGGGSLSPKLMTSSYAYMIGSAAGAYGGLLDKFDRHTVMVNHKNQPYYLIFDDLASSQPRTFTWSLYTAGWDSLFVNRTAVSGVTSSQTGNTLEVKKGQSDLFAQFVASSPLQIDTDMYASKYGPYIHASNTVKSSTQQFLTVLNTYNAAVSIPASVFQPTQVLSDGSTGSLSSSSALFRGSGVGSTVTWQFDVDKAGSYDMTLVMPNSYWYGIYQASVDGTKLGSPYDGYVAAPNVTQGNENHLGKIALSAGRHTLTMTCTGTSAPESSEHRYYTAVTNILLKDTADRSTEDQPVTIARRYDTGSTLGAAIRYADRQSDLVLFRRSGQTVTGGALSADAAQASLLGISGCNYEGYALTDGTSLRYQGRTLLTSSGLVSAYVDLSQEKQASERQASATVHAAQAATVSLYVGKGKSVRMLSGSSGSYQARTGMLTCSVPAGDSTVRFSVAEDTPDFSGPFGWILNWLWKWLADR